MALFNRFGWLLLTPLLAACGGAPLERKALPERSVFIALEHDFQEFRGWGSVRVSEAKAQGTTHPSGNDRLFVNAMPASAVHEFPVGTMIVKEIEPSKDVEHQIFAMVKRGGGFNARGAKDWEWFELKERRDASVAIMWRGVGAPKGEEYGGDPLGTCNNCHSMAAHNDFVKASALRLPSASLAAANLQALGPQRAP